LVLEPSVVVPELELWGLVSATAGVTVARAIVGASAAAIIVRRIRIEVLP